MNIVFDISVFLSCILILITVFWIYRLRQYGMNTAARKEMIILLRSTVVMFAGSVLTLVARIGLTVWLGLVAALVLLTGVSMFMNTLQTLVKKNTISYDKSDLVQLIMVGFWIAAVINCIIYGVFLWKN